MYTYIWIYYYIYMCLHMYSVYIYMLTVLGHSCCKHGRIWISTVQLVSCSNFHVFIIVQSPCARMPLSRATKQNHFCSLCGKPGHNVAKCDLPGAPEFRRLRLYKRKHAGHTPKDIGRKKSRLGFARNKKNTQIRQRPNIQVCKL